MHTEEDEVPVASKKKLDKGQTSSDVSANDKGELKKTAKSDGEDPKPRIVLTFRSDKKNSNMKIVPNEEKHEEFSPRRSNRKKNQWEWSEESERELSTPKKDKNSSQSVSETDETSDSSHTPKRSTRRRSKDSSDNVLANAIARKEKSYNETAPGPTQRLSRRIKPTAKILANEELRMGLESQNNARLGIQADNAVEGPQTRTTRNSARAMQSEVENTPVTLVKKETRGSKQQEEEKLEDESLELQKIITPEKKQSPNTVMKLKHLCELGLKAINPEALEDDAEDIAENEEEDEDEEELEDDDNEDMDDDSEVISKLLEADEDTSDEDFSCSVESSNSKRPRRSTRKSSGPFASYGARDNDSPLPVEDEQKETLRRSSRRLTRYDVIDWEYRPSRKRSRLLRNEEVQPEIVERDDSSRENLPRRAKNLGWDQPAQRRSSEPEPEPEEDNGEPAGGDEGSEATCPEGESTIVATCYCEAPTNIHAAEADLVEPVFCQAIEVVDGVRVGCSHRAARAGAGLPLRRAGPRAPFLLTCALHAAQLGRHMCCPACGLFCTQGIFYQCSEGHLFHLECGLPYNDVKMKPGCPHCGVHSYRWQPVNKHCAKVQLAMHCSNKRIFLPDQREQCTPAYLSFSITSPPLDESPLIPEDLLPSPPIDLKKLCQLEERDYDELLASTPAQRLADAILAGDSVEELLPKIVSRSCVNEPLASLEGGTAVHAACRRGHVGALYALQFAGADLDAPDAAHRSPLILALHTLLDKSEKKSPMKSRKINEKESKEETESKEVEESKEKEEENGGMKKGGDEGVKVQDEDLIKVIRYLIAAGCDVNFQDPEGMTALHIAAQHGRLDACRLLLDAAAQADARDHGGWTPLVWAAENAHADVVRLLLSAGAAAATVDLEGNGAVHWCALAGHAAPLRLLLQRAPLAAQLPNAHRDTPLHVAARQGHYSCVVILLARGARTDLENSAGELPVEVCSGACQSAISLNMQMTLVVKDSIKRSKVLSSDISNGSELYPIPCVNEVDDAPLPADFTYVTDHVLPEPLSVDNTIQSLQGCTCAEGSCCAATCACCVLSVRRWLGAGGRLLPAFPHHDPPMLFECNPTCKCNKRKCNNMVITRLKSTGSVFVRTQVFRTLRTGWALRAMAAVPRGSPVAVYCGELLPLAAADTRANDQYLFALDVKPDLLERCAEQTVLCVDARAWGGAARFVNHSCGANLAPVRVFAGARDLRLPAVALFATRDIRAGEELTFDYGDKFWSVKSKWMKCECGTPECRYPEKDAGDDG